MDQTILIFKLVQQNTKTQLTMIKSKKKGIIPGLKFLGPLHGGFPNHL